MTYSITKAEQELQSVREGLNLRWYPVTTSLRALAG